MAKSALVQAGTVVNIALGNPGGDYVDCPDNVQIGWTYSGGIWGSPVEVEVPDAVPDEARPLALHDALLAAGLWPTVQTAIGELGVRRFTLADTIERGGMEITQLVAGNILTQQQVDDAFSAAGWP